MMSTSPALSAAIPRSMVRNGAASVVPAASLSPVVLTQYSVMGFTPFALHVGGGGGDTGLGDGAGAGGPGPQPRREPGGRCGARRRRHLPGLPVVDHAGNPVDHGRADTNP